MMYDTKKNIVGKLLLICVLLGGGFFADTEETKNSSYLGDEALESPDEAFLRKVKRLKVKKLSDLAHLSPFSDVSVIQRRFMPKTGRMSVSTSASFVLSSAFALNPGVEGHLSYHFLEKHGLELSGYYVFTFNRQVSSDLSKDVRIKAKELSSIASAFFGLAYKWMPVYGKIAFYNEEILSFDTFFNFGGGVSGIKKTTKTRQAVTQIIWEPTFIAGIGQVFAITRDFGLRWDLRWHLTLETQNQYSMLNDILFSIGLSYYYPSAGLR